MAEKFSDVKRILIERDGNTPEEADELIADAKNRVMEGENPENILMEDFGLEPDYIFDILPF
jgi:hypothetical protein